jgi:glutamate--cysteine ligase
VIFPGERPLHALRERGVEYVEVRCMDLDPFVPVGIDTATMRFIDLFLMHCLLSDSPPDTPQEIAALGRNQHRTAARGREPGLKLERGDGELTLVDWGEQIVDEIEPLAEALDSTLGGRAYRDAWKSAARALVDADSLPSARVLATMHKDFDNSYVRFTRAQSVQTRNIMLGLPWTPAQQAQFETMARESVLAQRRIESEDTMPFEIYRQEYLAPRRLGG